MKDSKYIKHNIKVHNEICHNYERLHGEIFNPIEQKRLYSQLKRSVSYIQTKSKVKHALDYGCGTGNLTNHLTRLKFQVVSADIADSFLKLIEKKYGSLNTVTTLKINGYDLSNLEDNRFDLIASYSVLHHIPDYLAIVKEMIRVTKPGGVLYFDHEGNDAYWHKNKEYLNFLKLVRKPDWGKYLKPSNYVNRIHRMVDPRFSAEGDIHTRVDDHIEWDNIETTLLKNGCEIVFKKDYLIYRRGYSLNTYENYKNKCSDMYVLIARKIKKKHKK